MLQVGMVVSTLPVEEGPGARRRSTAARVVVGHATAIALVAAVTAVAFPADRWLGVPDVEMLYLLPIMVIAIRQGRGPALTAAAASVLTFDVVFVAPRWSLDVSDASYVLTFAMMFGVGVTLSSLAGRLRLREREARQAAIRAETEALRSALLQLVSHDLRTPLAVITGAASALREARGLDDATARELADAVAEEAERLDRMVANLLDMTRLEGGVVLRREWLPPEEIVGGALTRVERRLHDRPVRVDVEDGLPLVHLDPVLAERLLVNLVDNAIKHTPPTTPIDVVARSEGGRVVIEVGDRGPGLPQGDEERIFERFQRGRGAATDGTGLGLAIGRTIARAHGAELTAHARPGGGALFRLLLAAGDAPPPAPPPIGADTPGTAAS